MLVLSRKKNQEIMLGDDIKVTILETGEDFVKIGIDAPKDLTILRSELYKEVKQENLSAASGDKNAVDKLKGFL
ncbi:MAG: carbon storage regulator CsrA [Clostridiales bacterium]|nr:carbon storage regulator CsrA [Clostridiales bacterium]MCF8021760.1 carbon storage regulator CsrA [Clostridiales bacterium]